MQSLAIQNCFSHTHSVRNTPLFFSENFVENLEAMYKKSPDRFSEEPSLHSLFEVLEKITLPTTFPGKLTGYFTPSIIAQRHADEIFSWPIWGAVPQTYHHHPRGWFYENKDQLLDYVLCWVSSPVEAWLCDVQGSARVILEGQEQWVGLWGRNTHPYTSIGQLFREQGYKNITAPQLVELLKAEENPCQILSQNESQIFFQWSESPYTALGIKPFPFSTIAVDPQFIQSPVALVSLEGLHFLAIPSDIGSAIKGPHRADLYCGIGNEAFNIAGGLNTPLHLQEVFL